MTVKEIKENEPNIDEFAKLLRKTVKDYKVLKNKLESITSKWEGRWTTITDICSNINEEINVDYEYTCYGESYETSLTFPIAWLDMTDEELATAIEIRKEENKKQAEEQEKVLKEQYLKEQEEKERAEYERLKAKYEVPVKEDAESEPYSYVYLGKTFIL